jgi:ABC-type antimicrobial peptide transport system permease subunit
MTPLSPLTYYLRHKRGALLQIALISLATTGLFILVAVLDTIPQRANVSDLTKFSRVTPIGDALDPAVVSEIQTHPEVARTIPDNGLLISPPTLLGNDSQRLLGVSQEDAQYIMQQCGVRLKAGRMFQPHSNEFVLSEEVARALDLELGSEIGRTINQDYYWAISVPLVLVGTLEGDPSVNSGSSVRLGFISGEYLSSHELYAPRTTSLLVFAEEGHKDSVDRFLELTIKSKSTEVETFALLAETLKIARFGIYVIFGVVNSVVAIVMAAAVGIINRIAITQRLSEFGLLNALGHDKKRLIRRLTLETSTLAGCGYLLGLGIALAIMLWLKNSVFYDLGLEMDLLNPAPVFFVLPIPLITIALTYLSVRRIFAQLDAVAIVERGKLSEEMKEQRTVKRSSGKPLSSLTFYLRHRQRGVLMILSTALMVLGVTFPVFLTSAITSAMMPYLDYLHYISVIAPIHTELDPGIVGQVRSHPAVARTIPAITLGIQMILPPGGATDTTILGVSESDLPILLDVFSLQLREGRLPTPRSNEIAISESIAANRDLQVGDMIGGDTNKDDPLIYDNLPTEMVVSGILSPDLPWLGFASYEYLSSHELTASRSPRLLIIPHQGQKHTLDSWLEDNIDSSHTRIIIYDIEEREYTTMTSSLVLAFTLLECMIAAVAAIALATLNYIFFNQRREEFGILNAMGRGHRWLLSHTMKETTSVIGVAWILGALLCGIGLLGMQNFLYGPLGLKLDFFMPTPWLLTLPIPLAVSLASLGTIGWMLRRLDPVAIIERR